MGRPLVCAKWSAWPLFSGCWGRKHSDLCFLSWNNMVINFLKAGIYMWLRMDECKWSFTGTPEKYVFIFWLHLSDFTVCFVNTVMLIQGVYMYVCVGVDGLCMSWWFIKRLLLISMYPMLSCLFSWACGIFPGEQVVIENSSGLKCQCLCLSSPAERIG